MINSCSYEVLKTDVEGVILARRLHLAVEVVGAVV